MRDGEAASLADLRMLQGRWREIWQTDQDGTTSSSVASQAVTSFSGNTFTVRVPGRDPLREGTFVIDARTDPRSITIINALGEDAGKALHGIYDLQGDRLILVMAEAGCPFPTEFKGAPGLTIRMFIRN